MKFQYLGTSAAEGWPALFCGCEACRKAHAAGGKNIRTRSQAIVDDRLLIDFPPDTYFHMIRHGIDLGKVHDCIITHDHADHFHPEDLDMRRTGFSHPNGDRPMTVYGTAPVERKLRARIHMSDREKENRLLFRRMTPYVTEQIAGYQVTPLQADHDPTCEPVFYLIDDGRNKLLYAHDTGWFPDGTWRWLEREKPRLDFVSLDCTCILVDCRYNHMDLKTCVEVKDKLLSMGCATERTRFCLHHFSHNGLLMYDELVEPAKKEGFEVSHDGMIATLT